MKVAALLAAMTAALTIVSAASGGEIFRETIHDEGELVLESFCAAPGMTVELVFAIDLQVKIAAHGRERLDYFLQHGRRTEVLTNPANGKVVISTANVVEKDLRVTDNGDGTLTVVILATGNAVLYGADGKAIARNPGQTRFEPLLDYGGTPTDPSDDVELDFRVVKESTGRSDDFCDAAVAALG